MKGGDLFDAIAADTKYSELVSRRMVTDLTSALKYLHDKMIVHRDIKPENLLVNMFCQSLSAFLLLSNIFTEQTRTTTQVIPRGFGLRPQTKNVDILKHWLILDETSRIVIYNSRWSHNDSTFFGEFDSGVVI